MSKVLLNDKNTRDFLFLSNQKGVFSQGSKNTNDYHWNS